MRHPLAMSIVATAFGAGAVLLLAGGTGGTDGIGSNDDEVAVAVAEDAAVDDTAVGDTAVEDTAVDDGEAVSADTSPAGLSPQRIAEVAAEVGTIQVHRARSCDCCHGHIEHLEAAGFVVEDVVYDDYTEVNAVKRDLGIPGALWSCHTTVVDGYAVEGHVPVDVVAELLHTRPDVDGLALPGMPEGSPGMGSEQSATWSFATFTDGEASGVLTER